MGVALGEIALISEDVKTGRLIAPFKIYHPNPESFYPLYPKKIEAVPALNAFCVWALDEAAKNTSEAKMLRDVA
jgi:LysR family glycine cleavage system transcriptional activator